jgi:hypothetical protein
MEKEQRNRLQKATQDARRLLEEEFRSQLLQTYDIDVEKVRWAEGPGAHLQAEQRLIRDKLVAWIEHKEAQIKDRKEALLLALREMAFTALNRFVALKLMEARELVRPCVSGGLESAGFLEFTAVAQGLLADQESSYRLYLETIFEDVSRELRALFDPRDPASLLWPKRAALLDLLDILNRPELAELWIEDETLGWVYQYFNGDAERKKMREESSAPRNSRELAVRNQFFTPRYVVEFLTDNTLGRIWYEMRQGNTGLKDRCRYLVRRPNEIWLQPGEEPPTQADADEGLSQEELLRQPVYIPHRPLKDPREIRMLDPACGSMHFGLYSFDLYLEIYAEAWEIAQGSDEQSKQGEAFAPFVAYAAGFDSKAAFWREVPGLILQYNIHGIDIDPRATQIARLTLWLRAQRGWLEQQLQVVDRPSITRSNVVCAEPMPGEHELLEDFVDQQFPEAERGLVQLLLETIFNKMQLAGEAGSLLKIEEEIRDAIDHAKREWQKLAIHQRDLFSTAELAALGGVGPSLATDLQNLTKDFWLDIEGRIYTALKDYAEQAEKDGGFERKLFTEDASQGFSFIDVCRARYDVVLMNPPFGDPSIVSNAELQVKYRAVKHDIASAFIDIALKRLCVHGMLGSITTRTLFYLSYLSEWREAVLIDDSRVELFADFGDGVLEATVETAAHVISPTPKQNERSWFLRSLTDFGRQENLASAVMATHHCIDHEDVYLCDPATFKSINKSPFAYNVPDEVRLAFRRLPAFESETRKGFIGALTQDDFRFTRTWWETCSNDAGRGWTIRTGAKWVPYTKGGSYTPYFADFPLTINWFCDGKELKVFLSQYRKERGFADQWSSQLNAYQRYFCPGLTWSSRPNPQGSFWLMPSGVIFGNSGPSVQAPPDDVLWLLGILNSKSYRALLDLLMPRGATSGQSLKYEVGYVRAVPIPDANEESKNKVRLLVVNCVRRLRQIASTDECSHFFAAPFLGEFFVSPTLQKGIEVENLRRREIIDSLVASTVEIELICENSYSLSEEARRLLFKTAAAADFSSCVESNPLCSQISFASYASSLVSYLVGCLLGRWGIAKTRSLDPLLEDDDLFSELPFPSMAGPQRGEGGQPLPWADNSSISAGILIVDSEHRADIVSAIDVVIQSLWDRKAEDTTSELCETLGVSTLKEWFSIPSNFFADHLKRYTKSRRQSPVYWQLSAGNCSYSAWLYYHRFTQDTLYRVLHDFVEPRIQQAEREQFELESQGSLSGEAASRLNEAQNLLQDLRILKSELDLVAPLWNPNLNDGVIINHAILWRITPYTPWQKKCKECWDKLAKGDYDWAHLAFHLWPERVIPKCTTDRSLAIAHGLEERLWQETNNENWLPRQLSEADLQALISEHINPAVKSALERFLAAPPPVAPTRTRANRSTRASGTSTARRARGSAAVVDAEATRQVLLALTAAPSDGLAKTQIADLIGVEANALTAVIKQLKESGQIDQLGERRGARYVLSERGQARLEQEDES